MKKLEYMSSKLVKRMERMKSENELSFRKNEIVRTKESFSDDVLQLYVLLNGRYIMLAECSYMESDCGETIKSLNYGIDSLKKALEFNGNAKTSIAIQRILDKKVFGGGDVYVAYAIERFEEISRFLVSQNIEYFFDVLTDDILKNLYNAILNKNQDEVDSALEKRIRDIRKSPIDYTVILDYYSISLMRYAALKGIKTNVKVFELGYSEDGHNIFGL